MADESPSEHTVSWRGALAGLIFIVFLDGAYWLGGPATRDLLLRWGLLWSALFLALPLAYALSTRRGLRALGYRPQSALRYYLWGVAAGALWRLADTLYAAGAGGLLGPLELLRTLFDAFILVPLLEETFFRGYLQAGLTARLGPLPAVFIQALLFAGHPYHVAQGLLKLPSIFLFGVIAGLLTWRTRTLAAAWGAHGLANILPALITALAKI
jgi:membrane protease YdiL (CAAX protease family)